MRIGNQYILQFLFEKKCRCDCSGVERQLDCVMNSIVLAVCKKAKFSKEVGTGAELQGCYEGLSCTNLQEVVGGGGRWES